jgi:hypothetical protein
LVKEKSLITVHGPHQFLCLKHGIKMLFGFVAAGEVHPQPHILMFGKGSKPDFTW